RFTGGLKLIVWGFFKKMVIADNLAPYVNEVFAHPEIYHGAAVWLAALFFAFQIYCDFSGYSDIAIGSARILGYDLMLNFRQPYFSTSLNDFWRRWHISLSTWFRDYVYIPLGGNRTVKWRWYYNLMITFLVSGLWHGANWTFVIWGFLHAFFLILGFLFFKNYRPKTDFLKNLSRLIVFLLVLILWIFFRAENLDAAIHLLKNLFDLSFWPQPPVGIYRKLALLVACFSVFLLLIFEYLEQKKNSTLEIIVARNGKQSEWIFYSFLVWLIFFFGDAGNQQFIYFTF
ncbi:MAG TPA: MBOAT family O-acyltransferase, partial [Saprospiraceae bacterium]|nr:MBOAT family O-acyltransferase [Saprospiraceae bacterium]